MRTLVQCVFCLLFLAVVGCGTRLNDERTLEMEPGLNRTITIDPAPRDQKVRVRAEATGGPVNVYAFLEKDQAEAEKAVNSRKTSDKLLGSQEKTENADFEIQVPANTKALVFLTSAGTKKATVKMKITN